MNASQLLNSSKITSNNGMGTGNCTGARAKAKSHINSSIGASEDDTDEKGQRARHRLSQRRHVSGRWQGTNRRNQRTRRRG